MRLVICDDHRLLTEALASMLSTQGHVIEGIAYGADELLRVVAASDPDVCLLDVNLAGGTEGLTVARELLELHPRTKVVILSAVSDASVVAEAIDAGVVGFVRKNQNASRTSAPSTRSQPVRWPSMVTSCGRPLRAARRHRRAPTRAESRLSRGQEARGAALLIDGSFHRRDRRDPSASRPVLRGPHAEHARGAEASHSQLQATALIANADALGELRSGRSIDG